MSIQPDPNIDHSIPPADGDAAVVRPLFSGIVVMWIDSLFAWWIILCDTIHHGFLPEVTSLSLALILISRKSKVDRANGIARLVVELLAWMAVGITLLR